MPEKHFGPPILITIESQDKCLFDDIRDRETRSDLGLNLRITLHPTPHSVTQTRFDRIHRLAELGVVSTFDRSDDLLAVYRPVWFNLHRRARSDSSLLRRAGHCRLVMLDATNHLVNALLKARFPSLADAAGGKRLTGSATVLNIGKS